MKLIDFNPLISISFYNDITDSNVIGLVTTFKKDKPKEQHLLNVDDIPDMIDSLNSCIDSSGNKKKKKKKKTRSRIQRKELLKRRILSYSNDPYGVSCSWIVPEGTYMTAHGNGDPSYVKWPQMMFYLHKNGSLYIYYAGDEYLKDLFVKKFSGLPNVFDSHVCLGNSKTLNKKDMAVLSINEITDDFETVFFESKFSPPLKIDKKDNVKYSIKDESIIRINNIIKDRHE